MTTHKLIFKTILVGDSGVGKSSMLLRFTDNKFNPSHDLTIGVEFGSIVINVEDKTPVKLTIWDTAGQETFKSITRSYYRSAAGVLLCFDITNKKSFANIHTWVNEVIEYGPTNSIIILVGTKADLIDHRVISTEEALKVANEYKMNYIEVSSKTNVYGSKFSNEAFKQLAQEIYNNFKNSKEINQPGITFADPNRQYGSIDFPRTDSDKLKYKNFCCGI
ncbi:MAG: ras-related protein Rab-2-A [Terrestrivirus sp.]|uniref:Ras-related protein Rab-2-A n=1 Tax=Terrestrivirus sp. TaxID=2487775 RepID=A0A3G4ZMG5_9VIRU|nr:MAG: ras-related protein Rab-2-A [Terrestrivirus sp.]